jgi:hypothetical protein
MLTGAKKMHRMAKVDTIFAEKRWSLGCCSLLAARATEFVLFYHTHLYTLTTQKM